MIKTTTAFLVKSTSVCELDDTIVTVKKWVKASEIPTGKSIEILEKRELKNNWVWQNEIFTDCKQTGEPYAITNDYKVS